MVILESETWRQMAVDGHQSEPGEHVGRETCEIKCRRTHIRDRTAGKHPSCGVGSKGRPGHTDKELDLGKWTVKKEPDEARERRAAGDAGHSPMLRVGSVVEEDLRHVDEGGA